MKIFRKSAALMAIPFWFAGLAQAQIIQGTVMVASARPPERIEVLLDKDGQIIIRSQTDSSGRFSLRGMPFGAYEVIVRSEGYEEVRTRVDLSPPPAGITEQAVNLQLERKSSQPVVRYWDPVIDITQLNRNYPKQVLEEFDKGLAESRKDNAAKAIKHLAIVVRDAPDFYDAHSLLGSMYQMLDRFRDAEKEYKLAGQLNPQSAVPLTNLGSLYIQESDSARNTARPRGQILDDALDSLDEAVKLNPQAAMPFYLLGVAYHKSDFNDAAERHFKRALDMEPHMGSARLGLLSLYTEMGRLQSALENLDAYLVENPKAPNREGLAGVRRKIVQILNTASK